MIFLGDLNPISEDVCIVNFIHAEPSTLNDEMINTGVLVDTLEMPQQIERKQAILYVNIVTKKYWYEYEDIPQSKENMQSELNAKLLKDSASMQIELNNQKELNSSLLLKIAELEGKLNV